MASTQKIALRWQDLVTTATADSFHPGTIWLPAFGLGGVRCKKMELRGKFGAGTVSIVPAYQTCNDERNPDTAVGIPIENDAGTPAGYVNADGVYDPNSAGPTTLSTGDKTSIRFGWIIKVASGTGGGRVSGELEVTF